MSQEKDTDEKIETENNVEKMPVELASFEAALASLQPRPDRLDRDRLLFLAGQASVLAERKLARQRRSVYRPIIYSALSLTVVALVTFMVMDRRATNDRKDAVANNSPIASSEKSIEAALQAQRSRFQHEFYRAFFYGANASAQAIDDRASVSPYDIVEEKFLRKKERSLIADRTLHSPATQRKQNRSLGDELDGINPLEEKPVRNPLKDKPIISF